MYLVILCKTSRIRIDANSGFGSRRQWPISGSGWPENWLKIRFLLRFCVSLTHFRVILTQIPGHTNQEVLVNSLTKLLECGEVKNTPTLGMNCEAKNKAGKTLSIEPKTLSLFIVLAFRNYCSWKKHNLCFITMSTGGKCNNYYSWTSSNARIALFELYLGLYL